MDITTGTHDVTYNQGHCSSNLCGMYAQLDLVVFDGCHMNSKGHSRELHDLPTRTHLVCEHYAR